jgi:magnesium transporter
MLRTIAPADDVGPSPWIDLVCPDDNEVRQVEQRCNIIVPSLKSLREIESTSRLRVDGDMLYMSAPIIADLGAERSETVPTGFILSLQALITVRYAEIGAFDAIAAELGVSRGPSPHLVLARLLEEVVDRAADHLERAADVVDSVSRRIFFGEVRAYGLSKETRILRESIYAIGRASDRASRVRYMSLSLERLVAFVMDRCTPRLTPEMNDRFAAIRHDITSLHEFESSLSSRIQLVHDAATSLISIEQNDVVKVLTVASVVGVPPVLVAGVYGMNFEYMPELHWRLGYPFALALCLVSAIIPYLWFKWRDWL